MSNVRPSIEAVRTAMARFRRPRAAPAVPPARDLTVWGTLGEADRRLIERVRPYTLTSDERIVAAFDAVDHLVQREVPGALVECGVWRGGSVLAMILRLQEHGVSDRDFYLYDTFEGMTEPTGRDTSAFDEAASTTWARAKAAGRKPWEWLFEPDQFGLEPVRKLLLATGYPAERLHFVVGRVEDTLPAGAPSEVALLRLDTDWYESTRHELVHLYPRLPRGGVLIIDDYGHWEGCRQAVDEYFAGGTTPPLLARVDYACRMGLKA